MFPDGTQGPLVYGFGLCSWNRLPPSLYDSCISQTLTLQDITTVLLQSCINIPFGFIQSKVDLVQRSFYFAIAVSMGKSPFLTDAQFYGKVNEIFGVYNQANQNFVTYLVDGFQHCFTPFDLLYTADGLGGYDDNSDANTGIMMNDWLTKYPLDDGASVDTLCLGDLKSPLQATDTDTEYCSLDVSPKTFTESCSCKLAQ